MSATEQRDRAGELAKSDTPAARRVAREIDDTWFRAQALAWVARFADESEVEPIVEEALRSAGDNTDAYRSVGVAAWPVRALVERGFRDAARSTLLALESRFGEVQPSSSRSEALFLLFQATFDLGPDIRAKLVDHLATIEAADTNWRSSRCLVDAVDMIATSEPDLAGEIASAIANERTRGKALAKLGADDHQTPRPFFW